MSSRHPIIAITGSSGAGTTTVMRTFQHIFRREGIAAAFVEGDSFHRYDRKAMREEMKRQSDAGNPNFSHFGADANLLKELEALFHAYGETGTGKVRKYLHDAEEAAPFKQEPGTFTPWTDLPEGSDLLFYEGLHGAAKTEAVDVGRHADLLVGVVPIINLEWIQKLHRDKVMRGYSQEAVVDTILRRMPDYVNYIVHVEAEHDRRAGWQDAARDAAHLHADDPAADGHQAPRRRGLSHPRLDVGTPR